MSTGPDSWAEALDEVAAVADAVLFEGYLLYPYRASAQKNQLRWQWGVLTPEGYGTHSNEPSSSRTECLLEPRATSELHVRVRFLQVQERTVLDATGREVEELTVAGTRHLRWEEGIPRQVDVTVAVSDLAGGVTVPIRIPESETGEDIVDATGTTAGRLIRRCRPLTGRIVVSTTELPGPYDVLRLRLDVHNDAGCAAEVPREEALRSSLIGTHAVLAVAPGAFLSLTDPPEWARPAAAECVNQHTWPVLAGPKERSDLLLSSPIILEDHPQLAPESTVDLFDGTENDEILTLRTMALTDAEKAEARATDPRAAAVIDAVDALPPEILERLHGAIRSMGPAAPGPTIISGAGFGADSPADRPPDHVPWWDPAADAAVDPETDSVLVGGVPVAKGSTVRLRPGPGGDAQDLFLIGMRATVQAVVHDVDGGVHVAVTIDDPGSPDGDLETDLQRAHGRFRYFRPDELEVAP
ncbi:hypothetical protein ACVGVM_05595 [Pseudonocardia bannensis]|uniref:Uncharacterized protein n=1 Tax=Pseudonocardia bannensis TaxID=630973 RepID=A0A848DJV6_9PSEU|nr:hypothetical protein [Pseudonocardia bannensis]NMH92761.1 hypothetical protein [Pseudonocardia bannensis]